MRLFDMKRGLWNRSVWNRQRPPAPRNIREPAYRAYQAFTQKYPQWKESLFDEHFLKTRVIPMLAYAANTQKRVHPLLLARAWVEQFTQACEVRVEKLAHMANIMEEFLKLYESETGG